MNNSSIEPRIWAVIPAAGRGERFALSAGAVPKQYANLLMGTVLEWSVRPLLAEARIEAVVVVLAPDDIRWPSVASKLVSSDFAKPQLPSRLMCAVGGSSRQQSVLNGLDFLVGRAATQDWVLVHDAARPCITATELHALFAALDAGAPGVVLGTSIVDTVKRQQSSGLDTIDRHGLWRALTPQIFRFEELRQSLIDAARRGVTVTDEAQAMEGSLTPVLVQGSVFNIKVTRPEDLILAAQVLKMTDKKTMRVGQGMDVHAFGTGDHVMLGGVRIAYPRGVVAHSDGDVVIHALCDALLGALGQGDIGQHFPDSDPRYQGADSRVFLRDVADRMRVAGLSLMNADVTVLAEAPRIAAHRASMAATLAADLRTEAARINIKATTTEGLGFIGRGEGLAAQVSVLLA